MLSSWFDRLRKDCSASIDPPRSGTGSGNIPHWLARITGNLLKENGDLMAATRRGRLLGTGRVGRFAVPHGS